MNEYLLKRSVLLSGLGGYGVVQGDKRPLGIFYLFLQTFHNIDFIYYLCHKYVHMFKNSITTVFTNITGKKIEIYQDFYQNYCVLNLNILNV